MKILVTGGAGFLGSYICEALLDLNHEVIALDNLFTGSKNNISHLFSNSNFEFIRHDVTFPIFLEVDGIINMACPASPKNYQVPSGKNRSTPLIWLNSSWGEYHSPVLAVLQKTVQA